MRYINRLSLPVPAFFASSETVALRRNLVSLFESQGSKRSQTFVERSHGLLEDRLSGEMAEAFRNTCVYCETRGPGGPFRFRPETEAEPVQDRSTSHLYYAWLATSWDNWLWVCSECRPENELLFPVRGPRAALPDLRSLVDFATPDAHHMRRFADRYRRMHGAIHQIPPSWSDLWGKDSRLGERKLLIDPCTDRRPSVHVAVAPDGYLFALTQRGALTIDHFKLNRAALVEARSEEVSRLDRFLAERPVLQQDTFPDQMPFRGVIELRLRFLTRHIARALGWPVRPGWRGILLEWNVLTGYPDWPALFQEARSVHPGERLMSRMPSVSRMRRTPPARVAVPAPLPRLTGFEIQDFKSLERLSFKVPERARQGTGGADKAAAGALLILGENATGKSSILEAVVLCLAGPKVRKALKIDPRRLVLDPSFMDPELADGPDRSRLVASFADGSTRELTIADGQFQSEDERPERPVFAYGAFRQYLSKAPKRLAVDGHVATLFRTDRLLPNPTPWLLSLDPHLFDMVARSLRSIFAVEGDFDVIEREEETCYVVAHYVDHRGRRRRERTPLDIVSSGFRSILAMACDIMRGLMEGPQARHFQSLVNARAIILVDEIEAHLHPRWKLAIMASLREALPNVTLIVTSHDPLCLRGMASGEVLVMNRVRGEMAPGSKWPIFIETLSALPNIEELTIEQLLTADFFQLNSTSSRETDLEYARIADLLRRQRDAAGGADPSFTEQEKEALRSFTAAVNESLPIGHTEVQRIVQDAVADYLRARPKETQERLKALREQTRRRIRDALAAI